MFPAHPRSAGGTEPSVEGSLAACADAGVPELSDFVRAPNQAVDPGRYEVENTATDPNGVLAAALWSAAPWDGRDVLDLGCGSG